VGRAPDEAVVDRILDDVLERRLVLILGLDHLRPEPPAEDVIYAPVAVVEAARVPAVEVAHPVGEIRLGRLDEKVIVVAHQAARVDAPAVAVHDPVQEVDEERAVAVVEDDRRLVVAPRRNVIKRARSEVAQWPTHIATVAIAGTPDGARAPSGTGPLRLRHVPGRGHGSRRQPPPDRGPAGRTGSRRNGTASAPAG
jgi:hypothetical protein